MTKYEVKKLNMRGSPDFNSDKRIFQTTEKELYVKLANELKKGGTGFYIYQDSNRTARFLRKDGNSFVVFNADMRPINRFTIDAPKTATVTRKTVSRATGKGQYTFSMENERSRSKRYDSPGYSTLKQAYAQAYQQIKKAGGNPYIVCTFRKNGDFMKVSRSMSWNSWFDCIVLSMYGKQHADYRVYSDGRLKKLSRADIKKR